MNPKPGAPYPGIRPFREDEEFLFFGREAQVDAMVDTLARGRFLAVIGSSGCGKSSLVNCGLRPALHRGLLTRAGSAWRMASCRPGGNPLRALAAALAAPEALGSAASSGPFSQAELLEATLAMSRRGLVEAWHQAALPDGTRLLLIVDQFEELFRYRNLADQAEDGDPATAFVNLLLEARAQDVPIYIVLTMRSDFLGDCARFAGLPEAINGGQYLVPRMSRDERRAAIQGPARVCGADIAPTLLTRLVNDVGDDPDQLSLLQHALARCWAHWQASGEPSPIEARHYDAIGTLTHALNQHAEEIFSTLPETGQKRCAAAFRALTDKSTDSRGIRRPTRFADLAAITASSDDELAATLAPFRAPGAAFLMPPAGDALCADTIVDLSHESLMRIWDRLCEWGEREADAARMLRRLADAAELHAAGQASLWRDPELQFALDWRERSQPTAAWARQYGREAAPAQSFLDASRQARDAAQAAEEARLEAERRAQSDRNRNRRTLRLTIIAIVATTLFAGVTSVLWKRAEHAAEVAISRQLAAQSSAELSGAKLNRALQLAAAGFAHAPSFEAHDSLLAALVRAPQTWTQTGQQGVLALASSPDGTLTASGGKDGSIKLWQPDGSLAATLRGHTDRVLGLAFAPDGHHLASASADGNVRLWNVATRQAIGRPLDEHQGAVLSVAFSPDGRLLASAGADQRVLLRDADSGALRVPPLVGHQDTITQIAFSPDGSTLASVGYDGALILWSSADGAARQHTSHPAVLHAVAFSPDGALIATASADRHVQLWNSARLSPVGEPLSGHSDAVRAVAFSPDGRHLASAGDKHELLLWNLPPGDIAPRRADGHSGDISAVAFAPDGRSLVSGGSDDVLIRHAQPQRGPFIHALPGVVDAVWAVAWSPDGRRLATVEKNASLRLRDATSGAALGLPLSGHTAITASLAFTPDGQQLVSAGQDGRLLLWNLNPPAAAPARLLDAGPPLRRVAIRPDGRQLAAAGRDGRIRLWSLPDGTPLATMPEHGGPVADLAWTRDGRLLASAGFDGRLRLWQGSDLQAAGQISLPQAGALYRIAWTADSQHLAIASQRAGLLLWQPGSAEPQALGKDTSALLELALSPDGQTLASADKDGHLRLWDMATRQPLRDPLLRHAGPVLALAWAPDGSRIASAGWDRGIMIARTRPADWAALACALVGNNPPAADAGTPTDGCPAPNRP